MSEKPQEDRQEDLLEQIFTQGLEKIKAPQQATDPGDGLPEIAAAPDPEDGEGPAPAANRKNRRFAVTPYLLFLFGAAFLITLLALFIQRRSHETALSDLRDSMDLSQAELLEQIRALEEENATLSRELESWKTSSIWEERYNAIIQGSNDLMNSYSRAQTELNSWQSFWELEQFYQAGDYKSCASILLEQAQGQYYRTPNGADRRYEEIVQTVIKAGFLHEDYRSHPEDYDSPVPASWQREPQQG